jgi:nitrogen-specific signal transduction histidine kinase
MEIDYGELSWKDLIELAKNNNGFVSDENVFWLGEDKIFRSFYRPGLVLTTLEVVTLIEKAAEYCKKIGFTDKWLSVVDLSRVKKIEHTGNALKYFSGVSSYYTAMALVLPKNETNIANQMNIQLLNLFINARHVDSIAEGVEWLRTQYGKVKLSRSMLNSKEVIQRTALISLSILCSFLGILQYLEGAYLATVMDVMIIGNSVLFLYFSYRENPLKLFFLHTTAMSLCLTLFVLTWFGGGLQGPTNLVYWPTIVAFYLILEKRSLALYTSISLLGYASFIIAENNGAVFQDTIYLNSDPNIQLYIKLGLIAIFIGASWFVAKWQQWGDTQITTEHDQTIKRSEKIYEVLAEYAQGNFNLKKEKIHGTDLFAAIEHEAYLLGDYLRDTVVSKGFYEQILNSTRLNIFVLDDSFQLKYQNTRTEKLFQGPAGQEKFMNVVDAIVEEESQSLKKEVNVEKEIHDKYGTMYFSVYSTRMKENEKHRLVIIDDITEQVLNQKEKDDLNLQLVQAGKLASMGTLVAGVGHELNNPLTVVRSSLTSLRKRKVSEEKWDSFFDRVERQMDRIQKIINNLRRFSRKQDESDISLLNINQVIKQSIDVFQKEAELKEVVIYNNTGRGALFYGNEVNLESVIQNLVKNSLDAFEVHNGKKGKMITIDLVINDDLMQLVYKDNAGGISPDDVDKIFDPFFTTKSETKGTGIGMSLCRSIIESLNGSIQLENEYGKGVVFIIKIPLAKSKKSYTV